MAGTAGNAHIARNAAANRALRRMNRATIFSSLRSEIASCFSLLALPAPRREAHPGTLSDTPAVADPNVRLLLRVCSPFAYRMHYRKGCTDSERHGDGIRRENGTVREVTSLHRKTTRRVVREAHASFSPGRG